VATDSIARIDVVGLGPAGADLISARTRELIDKSGQAYLRTSRHPAAAAFPQMSTFDHRYDEGATLDEVYRSIVSDLVETARRAGSVVYAVPGSPVVAERTVDLLRSNPAVTSGEVSLWLHPAISFLDLAFARLGIDPVIAGVRIVDGETFASSAAGEHGPMLVAQCWSPSVLSGIKLSTDPPTATTVTVLHHLGLDDERIWEIEWHDLDRSFAPDHLTSLWISEMASPVATELVELGELVRTLRARCPWDRTQTHGSLRHHLLEESYEVLEAIDALSAVDAALAGEGPNSENVTAEVEERAVSDLEEELGDLLFQVYFHSRLAEEAGRFTVADVARGVHDKLISRHPHVFGDAEAATSDQLASNWETLKKLEKNRSSVTEGIPAALPSLALAAKLLRKGLAVGMTLPGLGDEVGHLASGAAALAALASGGRVDGLGPDCPTAIAADVGDLLFSLVNMARVLGVDAESALRVRAAAFRSEVERMG
jgi:tetrapyrrole methylase family protein / MazG family protein